MLHSPFRISDNPNLHRSAATQLGIPGWSQRLLLVILAITALLFTNQTEAAVRICTIGDSITEGQNGEYTYRYYLWHKLRNAGYDVDFVGKRWGVSWGQPATTNFDLDHEGRWGWRIDQVTSEGFWDTQWNVWLDGLGTTIKQFQMDVALVYLGLNDIFQGESTSQLVTDMRAHIALLRQYNPNTVIFVARPYAVAQQWNSAVQAWGNSVAQLATELNTAQSPVIAVNFWNTYVESYDTTHPTDAGYRVMADVWFAALDTWFKAHPPTGSQTVANGIYKVVSRLSGKALDAFGAAQASNVGQWTYHGGSNQRWRVTHLGNNQYKLEEQRSGYALDVDNWSTVDGGRIHIWGFNNQANQKWTITPTSGGYFKVESVHSGKALDVKDVSTADGALVHQWGYGGGQNQQWIFLAP